MAFFIGETMDDKVYKNLLKIKEKMNKIDTCLFPIKPNLCASNKFL